jgi:hypothetical protein
MDSRVVYDLITFKTKNYPESNLKIQLVPRRKYYTSQFYKSISESYIGK